MITRGPESTNLVPNPSGIQACCNYLLAITLKALEIKGSSLTACDGCARSFGFIVS